METAHPYRRGIAGRVCAICEKFGRHPKHRKPCGRIEYVCTDCKAPPTKKEKNPCHQ